MAASNDEENVVDNPDVGFAQPARQRSLEKQVHAAQTACYNGKVSSVWLID